MPERVLGVNGNIHDSAVCLLEDGRIVYAVEEERLNRRKHYGGPPERALATLARETGIDWRAADHIALPWKAWRFLAHNLREDLARVWTRPALHLHSLAHTLDLFARHLQFEKRLRNAGRPLHVVEHHLAHAASAFFVSPFEEAAILTWDARGEDTSTLLSYGKGLDIEAIRRIRLPHSIGHLYAQITDYLGFGKNDEYKVMGLAAYGSPVHKAFFDRALALLPDGDYRIDRRFLDYYRGFTEELLREGPPRGPGEPVTQFHRDVAASLQARLEEAAFHLADFLRRETGSRNLCIAGGVGLNGVANGKLLARGGVDGLYVQPAAGDSGLAIGSAFHVWHTVLRRPRAGFVMRRADFGPAFSQESVAATLRRCKVPFRVTENPAEEGADRIARGEVIGWFQGRSEFGPRALGHRSILADPRDGAMKDRVNALVKNREEFRPFAPALLAEETREYFDADPPFPFMIVVLPVRPEKRPLLGAVTHVDGTARLQTVSRPDDPLFHELISRFKARTGVAAILNTSFNVQGEPIVHTPEDALRTFFASGLDALLIERCLITKR